MVTLQTFNSRTPEQIKFCPDLLLENKENEDRSQCQRASTKCQLLQDQQHYSHTSHMVYTKPYV